METFSMSLPIVYSNRTTKSLDAGSFYAYVIEGGILLCFNLYLAIVILFTRRLRSQKEYILIASNMLFDATFGLAYFVAGIYRLKIYYTEEYVPLYSKWQCFLTFHTILFTIVTPGVGWIAFFTCIVSLISVWFPLKYLKLNSKFAYFVPILSCLCIVPTFVLLGVTSYEVRGQYTEPALCNLQNSGSTQVYQSLRAIRIACSIVSVPIYIPIAYRMYLLIKTSYAYTYGLSKKQRQKLVTMTLTIALITLNQLLLFGVPDFYLMLNPANSLFIFYIMNLNKGIINVLIFLRTQKELRSTIFQVTFQCCLQQTSHLKTVVSVIRSGNTNAQPNRIFGHGQL